LTRLKDKINEQKRSGWERSRKDDTTVAAGAWNPRRVDGLEDWFGVYL
jgi:hypothetical protein